MQGFPVWLQCSLTRNPAVDAKHGLAVGRVLLETGVSMALVGVFSHFRVVCNDLILRPQPSV